MRDYDLYTDVNLYNPEGIKCPHCGEVLYLEEELCYDFKEDNTVLCEECGKDVDINISITYDLHVITEYD